MITNNLILPEDEQEMTVSTIKGLSPEPIKSENSGLLEGTQRILYQGDATDGGDESSDDGFHIDNDDDSGPGLKGNADEEMDSADDDVDEHKDESGPSIKQQISPIKLNTELKRPLNIHPRHRRNLSDVVETGLSSGQVSVDQSFLSPDLIALKHQRQNAAAARGLSDGKMPNGKMPNFRQPAGKRQAPSFSLQLMTAVQELKENEANPDSDDEGEGEDLSVVNRRIHGQEVIGDADEQLRKLISIKMQKRHLLDEASNPADLISNYQDDSSQLQSFANSPDVMRHLQTQLGSTSPLKNISPVKGEDESLISQGPLKSFTPQKQKSAQKSVGVCDDEDSDEGEIKFEMYSPMEDEPMQRVPFGVHSTGQAVDQQAQGQGSFFDGMKDFLVRKKLNFDNMVTKLNEVEERLAQQQALIDKQNLEEEKKEATRTLLEDEMAEATYYVTEVDREGMSKSSGGNQTATTREDSGEEDLSTFSMTAKQEAQRRKIKRIRQMKKASLIEEVTFDSTEAEKKNPRLFNSCVNQLDLVDLTQVDPNQMDAQYFAIKQIFPTGEAVVSETSSVNSFDVVESPDKKQKVVQQTQEAAKSKKKKKFVKRLVPRPGGKPKKQQEGSSETQKMKQLLSDIFSVDGFRLF